jgi:peptidoglycan/LPS O-acetylase OafA/YrhL
MVKTNNRFGSVDVIRIIAIILVIIFHYLYIVSSENSLRKLGFIGVSLFFIVSGYLLSKKYPNHNKFSLKWFLSRYIKIASLYYLALIALVILFGKQIYYGSLFENLSLHFLFLDFLSPNASYGIISLAWFLIPLMGLYLLFPYLNDLIKKNPKYLFFIFYITIAIRFLADFNLIAYSFYSPLFYLGEFCFGILFAYNKKSPMLLAGLLVILIQPFMVLPFAIFYLIMLINIPSNGILSFVGSNTLALFLFQEAFIAVYMGRWNIYSLNKVYALVLLVIVVVILVYLSKIIQRFFLKRVNNLKK